MIHMVVVVVKTVCCCCFIVAVVVCEGEVEMMMTDDDDDDDNDGDSDKRGALHTRRGLHFELTLMDEWTVHSLDEYLLTRGIQDSLLFFTAYQFTFTKIKKVYERKLASP